MADCAHVNSRLVRGIFFSQKKILAICDDLCIADLKHGRDSPFATEPDKRLLLAFWIVTDRQFLLDSGTLSYSADCRCIHLKYRLHIH